MNGAFIKAVEDHEDLRASAERAREEADKAFATAKNMLIAEVNQFVSALKKDAAKLGVFNDSLFELFRKAVYNK